jgi:hypothetical protein
MDRDQKAAPQAPEYSYDSTGTVITYSYTVAEPVDAGEASVSPPYTFEHDRDKGVYRLAWSDGEVEVFRDKPTRYLVVEPGRQPGELRPVITRGYPTYLYICREEREVS